MFAKKKLTVVIAAIFLAFFVLQPNNLAYAEDATATAQAELQKELDDIEKEIASFEKQLTVTASQKKTLANKIAQLKIKQNELNALIKQTTLKVTSLQSTILLAEKDLNKNIIKEMQLKLAIADTLRLMNQKDTRLIILLASNQGFSQIFSDMRNEAVVSSNMQQLVDRVQAVQAQIADKKETLEGQKSVAVNLLEVKSIQKDALLGTLSEQNTLLIQTKGLEKNYQASLADSKKRATEIRNRIYELFNSGKQVNFGQAVDIAKWASGLTGVRPAFLLAILTQESNLGKNVGTCNRLGDPPKKSWRVVMKPTRDQTPFLAITKELGLDTDTTPVSCPMTSKGKQVGWGGAMGPAQFIPSTWMGYKNKVAALTNKSPANPWDIRDAFVASGLKLRSNGADGTDAGEWKAAMYYFSGGTNPAFRFYGDNVLATAKKYQKDIDQL